MKKIAPDEPSPCLLISLKQTCVLVIIQYLLKMPEQCEVDFGHLTSPGDPLNFHEFATDG